MGATVTIYDTEREPLSTNSVLIMVTSKLHQKHTFVALCGVKSVRKEYNKQGQT